MLTTTEPDQSRAPGAPPAAQPRSWLCVIITCALLCAWCAIFAFAIVTWINPPWLQAISQPGRTTEMNAFASAGVQRLREGDYEGAILGFRQALEVQDDPQTRVHLAVALGRAGQPQRALELLQELLASNPGRFLRGVILYNIADMLLSQPGKLDEAAQHYQEALAHGAEPDRVYRQLGRIYMAQRKVREALAAFEKSLQAQLDPMQGYRNMLQRSLEGYSVVETEDVEADAASFSEKDMERYDLTLIKFQQINNPDVSMTCNEVGAIHAQLGDLDAARQYFEEALRIWPQSPNANANMKRLEAMTQAAKAARPPSSQGVATPASSPTSPAAEPPDPHLED